MLITEIEVKKSETGLVKKKLNLLKVCIALFIIFGALAIAHIIYLGVSKFSDYNPYLFSGFSLLVSISWLFILFFELKRFNNLFNEIMEKGSARLVNNASINLRKNVNGNTIVNYICAGIVLVCVIAIIILEIINFNVAMLSYILLCGTLALFLIYQSYNALLNDKIYRNSILIEEK